MIINIYNGKTNANKSTSTDSDNTRDIIALSQQAQTGT
jgi:hypothetical protein